MPELSKNQIKFIRSLHQKKYRQEYQMFLLEGEKLVNEALRDKPNIICYIIVKNNYNFQTKHNVEVYTVSDYIINSISTLSSSPPVMAVCRFLPQSKNILIDLKKQFSFYLDDINDPGNLGTIIRICDWFGIHQLICSPNTVDLYNPKTINASKGSFLRVNVLYSEFEKLNLNDTNIFVADMKGESIYSTQKKTGLIILGNESHGVSDSLKSKVKTFINIPKYVSSKAESLNVAMSAAIIASEFSKNYL